jgi:hypothetical protein
LEGDVNRWFWTTKEIALLREHYSQPRGVDRLCLLLPNRSRGSIMQHGASLKIRAHKQPNNRNRWRHDEHTDQAIRFVYQNNPTKGAINSLAAKLNRPRWWVSKRAVALGLVVPRFKETEWCEREVEILERNHFSSLKSIRMALARAGFKRSETAILVKRKRLRMGCKDPNSYTATELAGLMGVDAKTVIGWIEKFGLTATRKPTERTEQQGGDPYQIRRHILRAWIGNNAARCDLRKVDRFWFIDLLIGFKEEKAVAA